MTDYVIIDKDSPSSKEMEETKGNIKKLCVKVDKTEAQQQEMLNKMCKMEEENRKLRLELDKLRGDLLQMHEALYKRFNQRFLI